MTPSKDWMRLDNAAKIYPAARSRRWSNVFRLSATLTEPVDATALQSALAVTVKRFPSMAVGLRRGFFWFYLQQLEAPPQVIAEGAYPCVPMHGRDLRHCAFRVLYYQRRIAVEFFHALTDGNGGLVFLKTLVAEYLTQKHRTPAFCGNGVLDRQEEPSQRELEDSFLKYDGPVSASRWEPDAYRLTGTLETDGYRNLITGILPVEEALAVAKGYGVSLTSLLVAVLMASILEIQEGKGIPRRFQRPAKVLIPVNLRRFFDSESLRNFVLYVIPGVNPRLGELSFEEILKSVYHQLGLELTANQMATRITANVRAERSWLLKVMPLPVKNLAIKLVYRAVGEKKSCLTLSNLGSVTLPEGMEQWVERFDFVLGAQSTCVNNCGVLSYNGKLIINFIRKIQEPTLEAVFFRRLRQLGLTAKLESNQRKGA